MALTHEVLVQLAARWLRRRCAIVVTEVSTGPEIPDALGWEGQCSVLVECKTSRADFRADAKKSFRLNPGLGMGNYRWYLTPSGLLSPDELPAGWGLLETAGRNVRMKIQACAQRQTHVGREAAVLRSVIRRIGQDEPRGVSIRAYTHQTKCSASVSTDVDDRVEDWLEPMGSTL